MKQSSIHIGIITGRPITVIIGRRGQSRVHRNITLSSLARVIQMDNISKRAYSYPIKIEEESPCAEDWLSH